VLDSGPNLEDLLLAPALVWFVYIPLAAITAVLLFWWMRRDRGGRRKSGERLRRGFEVKLNEPEEARPRGEQC
jgi:hypothetical protein